MTILTICPACNTDSLIQIDVYWGNNGKSRYTKLRCGKCGFLITIEETLETMLAEASRAINNKQENKGVTQMPYKPELNPEITAREIIDFETKGNVIRFYLGKNGEQRGNDWDDRPYECNAGTVYDEFVGDIVDLFVSFDYAVLQPSDGWNTNSGYCKEDMRDRNVPCIIIVPPEINDSYYEDNFAHWVGSDNVIKIYFGDSIDDLMKKMDRKYLRMVTKRE